MKDFLPRLLCSKHLAVSPAAYDDDDDSIYVAPSSA